MNAFTTRDYLSALGSVVRSDVRPAECDDCGHSFLRTDMSAFRCPRCLGDRLVVQTESVSK